MKRLLISSLVFLSFSSVSAPSSPSSLDFDFQTISIPDALQLLADYKQQNIVISPDVVGNISLKLNSVSWDSAFDYIMRIGNLDAEFGPDAIYVTSLNSPLSSPDLKVLDIYPTFSHSLSHILPSALVPLFRLSDGESLIPSDDLSIIVANLSPSRNLDLTSFISSVDLPRSQILIEARVVEVNRDFSSALGVNWGSSFSSGSFSASASSALITSMPTSLGLGFVSSRFTLDNQLSLMESSGQGVVVSSPKIFVFDGRKGLVSKGFEIPYSDNQGDGVFTTSFKDASLSFEVTPRVSGSNVSLDILFTKDEPDFSKVTSGPPPVSTARFSSSVKLLTGSTVALGGVFSSTDSNSHSGVPFLKDLPLIGAAFKSKASKVLDSELLLFITATIIEDNQYSNYDYSQWFKPISLDITDFPDYYDF